MNWITLIEFASAVATGGVATPFVAALLGILEAAGTTAEVVSNAIIGAINFDPEFALNYLPVIVENSSHVENDPPGSSPGLVGTADHDFNNPRFIEYGL